MHDRHLKITVFSHHFSVTELTARGRAACYSFSNRLVAYAFIPQGGRMIRQATKVYAARTDDKCEFRFHINMLKDFKTLLHSMSIDEKLYSVVEVPMYEGKDIELSVKPEWIARDYQIPIIDYLQQKKPISKMVSLQTGQGKLQPLDSLIKIPGGWATMGDMKVGTEVIAKDGTTTHVTAIYPQGKVDIYKITFSDGRSTECGGEHLWKIFDISKREHLRWTVCDTNEIIKRLNLSHPRIYIDLIDSEDCVDVSVPINPYLLGVYLGDGSSRKMTATVTTPDQFIIDKISTLVPLGSKISQKVKRPGCWTVSIIRDELSAIQRNPFTKALTDLELLGKIHFEKRIPEVYLHASKSQRLQLIQGLIDTDGYVGKEGTVQYTTVSEDLALGVQYLARSLGCWAKISTKIPHYTYKGEYKTGRLAYTITIRSKTPSELVTLPKKADRVNDDNQYSKDLKLRVSKVELIGQKEAQCISIDHPDRLYVTDHFIVTHNTFIALKSIGDLKKRTVIVIKPTFIEKWTEDLLKTYSDITLEDILVVRGGDQLMALLELAKHNQIDAKFIIISNRTYQNWIKMYEKYHFESLDMGYACLPIEMYQSLKAGIKLIDEAHLEFHSVFKHELYTHVPSSVALTATLISDDPLVSNMHKVVFPTADRYKEIELIKYIDSYAVHYRFNNPDKIRTSEYGSKNFSMNAVETSIMRHIPTLKKYLELVEYCFSISYLKVKRSKKKCIIFAYTKEMCGLIVDHLKKKYPQFDIRRYVGEDPWENLMNADVTATTIGSAGTGVDIPDLTTAIMTTSVNSTSSNIQTFGRLRQLKDNHPVEFLYLVSEDIPKMVQYHYSKKQILQQRCKTFRDIYSGHVV